jgi:hypothetical protein
MVKMCRGDCVITQKTSSSMICRGDCILSQKLYSSIICSLATDVYYHMKEKTMSLTIKR